MSYTYKDNTEEILRGIADAKQRALERIGLSAEGYAKKECPVDTGNLRNSITHARDDDAAYIGTNVEYAPYVELGTSRMKAQPFLRPAATEHTTVYRRILEDELKGS
jgi:HK97 gp10 family phage protein